MQHIHEECGVFGIFNRNEESVDTAKTVYYALYALQHRGQEACGIAVNDHNLINLHKDLGLVHEVFDEALLSRMPGGIAIGHVRYSTTGGNNRRNIQPLGVDYIKGSLVIAHNGNISNAAVLRKELEQQGAIFQCTSDTEVIAFLIAKERLNTPSVEEAVRRVLPRLEGSFSLLVMSPSKLIAARDSKGMRPLCMGRLEDSVLFASESCALDAIGATFERDLAPGELLVVEQQGQRSIRWAPECERKDCALCIFEHIYFARPDSVIDGQSVYNARIEAGRILARTHPVQADLVIGVPDSGLVAAIGFAQESGIPYGEGLVKNRYIGRTFIQPTQSGRESAVSIKLSPLKESVRGKRVVMVDDSIVRGTTMRQIVELLKKAGAAQVHVRISAPEFLWPCYYGTDIDDRSHLASVLYTHDELCSRIGADSLGFLPLDQVEAIAGDSALGFCKACFSGQYPWPVPTQADKTAFE
ncbi:MAG: amidophosphoribosyltransferase [Candidatus Spyradocola sp.]|nr:amidophosphoribosyltransferase [Candidatus Spyradocola sp.]